MLSAAEIASIRSDIEDTFDGVCLIEQVAQVVQSSGAVKETYTTRAAAAPCTLRHASETGYRNVRGEQTREQLTWMLSVAHSQTVETTDRVTVGSKVFYVRSVNTGDTNRGCTRCTLDEA